MKEQVIQKINKIGKISGIITTIAKVLVGIGVVLTLVGTIICFVIPKDLLKFSVVGDVIMEMNYASLGVEVSDAEVAEMQEHMKWEFTGDADDFSEVSVTDEKITMKGVYDDFSFSLRDLSGLLILALITMVMTLVTLFFVGALCKAFRDCQSPFEESVIKKMQHLAYALIPWTVVATVTNSIADSVMNHKMSLSFTLDLGVVLIVLVVLVLVHIFKYGAVLQQESDETL